MSVTRWERDGHPMVTNVEVGTTIGCRPLSHLVTDTRFRLFGHIAGRSPSPCYLFIIKSYTEYNLNRKSRSEHRKIQKIIQKQKQKKITKYKNI